jgi:transposase-like protein
MDLKDFPKTMLDFERRFAGEGACRDYLWSVKWPHGFICPRCGGRRAYFVIERGLEQCASCNHQTSVTAGTMFHGSRTPLKLWFRAIFEFISRKHGCNAMDLVRLLGVSYPTAWTWLHKIRDVLMRRERDPLRGRVEADETYVGGPEPGTHGRGRGENKVLVAGAVEVKGEGCGRVRLAPAQSAGADDIQPFLVDAVEEGAIVHTDGWGAYSHLDEGYDHRITVIGDDPKEASKVFPRIHRVFALFKRVILGTYQGSWSHKYAPLYCEEYAFRFNRRTSSTRTHLFRRIVEQAVRRRPRIHLLAGKNYLGLVVPEPT